MYPKRRAVRFSIGYYFSCTFYWLMELKSSYIDRYFAWVDWYSFRLFRILLIRHSIFGFLKYQLIMGVIKSTSSEEFSLLHGQHLVGRNAPAVHTYLPGLDISKLHATLFWKNNHWHLSEHSRNGTLVNEVHHRQVTLQLKKGDILQFGEEENTKWVLLDTAPPSSYLQAVNNQNVILSLTQQTGIPTPEPIGISFFYTPDHRWRAEKAGKVIALEHGTALNFSQLNQDNWTFVENEFLDETTDKGNIVRSSYFQLYLSEDEERIQIKLMSPGRSIDLGDRAHNYMLLALVRQRASDRNQGKVKDDQGWVSLESLTDEMSRETRKLIDQHAVNLQIHRLRKQLLNISPHGYLFSHLIERRRGELRFAHPYYQLIKAGEIVVEDLPEMGILSAETNSTTRLGP